MIAVSRDSFFATVGQLDVHPHIVGGYDAEHGYTSNWKLRSSDRLIGRTIEMPKQFLVTDDFFQSNRTALVAV